MVRRTVETPTQLFATQVIVPAWMKEACEGAEQVRVTREVYPFGTYVMAVEPVTQKL